MLASIVVDGLQLSYGKNFLVIHSVFHNSNVVGLLFLVFKVVTLEEGEVLAEFLLILAHGFTTRKHLVKSTGVIEVIWNNEAR
jgi:hypothetical protein